MQDLIPFPSDVDAVHPDASHVRFRASGALHAGAPRTRTVPGDPSMPSTPLSPRPRRRSALFAGALPILAIACLVRTVAAADPVGTDPVPMPGESSRTLVGTGIAGLYRVELRGLPDPLPLNRMHEWVVHVETGDGVPVTGAAIAMSGGMPIHDHGLPTAPRVTEELGGGDYLLEGVRFQMGGHWVVELAIEAAPGTDSVAFDLHL